MEQMMEVYNNEMIDIDVKESFIIHLHKVWMIGIIGILFAVCTGMVNVYLLPPEYTSTARVYMINDQRVSGLTLELGTGSQRMKDYRELIHSEPVLEQVIQELQLEMSSEELAQRVVVTSTKDSWISEINVVCNNPAMAKKIADTIVKASLGQLIDEKEMRGIAFVEEGNLPTVPANPYLITKVLLGGVFGIIFSLAFLALGHLIWFNS
jgi:capsular polysaccharide biosynthesis protein